MSPGCRNPSTGTTRGENDAHRCPSAGLARGVLLLAREIHALVRPETTGNRPAVPERLLGQRRKAGILRRTLQLLTRANPALLLLCNARKLCYARLRCRIP